VNHISNLSNLILLLFTKLSKYSNVCLGLIVSKWNHIYARKRDFLTNENGLNFVLFFNDLK